MSGCVFFSSREFVDGRPPIFLPVALFTLAPAAVVPRAVEVPKVQFLDRVVGVPMVMQRQVPAIQKHTGNYRGALRVQFTDRMVDDPTEARR